MRITQRAQRIEPFFVMEVAKAAQRMAQDLAGHDWPMLLLNIGEPDFTAAPLVQERATAAIRAGQTQYTPATGLMALRLAISQWYLQRFGLRVEPERIIVTAGASGALQLACLTLIESGDEILMPDPSYPCNRHFVSAANGHATLVPTTAQDRYQLSPEQVAHHWQSGTRGVLLASPSNPTGTSIAGSAMKAIHDHVQAKGGITLVDEIYLGLSFEEDLSQTALALDERVISINSFSKYFSMTGWRLGWMVAPPTLVPSLERLAQNLFICPSTIAQHAALACFEPESLALFEERRLAFKARRDFLVPALRELGFGVPLSPDGAFYVWSDCRPLYDKFGVNNSWDFTFELMKRAHIALAPGRDFGSHETEHFVRWSIASALPELESAVQRIQHVLENA
jgi:aspartate/methionine/tyrosine aminotransferase